MSTGKTLALHSALNRVVSSDGGDGGLYIIRADWISLDGNLYNTDGTSIMHTIDKPAAEIHAAFQAGKTVVCDVYRTNSLQYRMTLATVTEQSGRYFFNFFAAKHFGTTATLQIAPRTSSIDSIYEADLRLEIHAQKSDFPIALPNPYPLVYIDKDGNQTDYTGEDRLIIKQEVTERLDWCAVTNKPFTSEVLVPDTQFNYENVIPGFESFQGMSFILTPFELEEGVEYITTINGVRFESMCTHFEGTISSEYIAGSAIGNVGAFTGEPNRLPFVALQFAVPLNVNGMNIYGSYIPLIVTEDYMNYIAGTFNIARKDKTDYMLKSEAMPLMGADTIGGAKIGNGLLMAGDVLQVDMDAIVSRVLAAINAQ